MKQFLLIFIIFVSTYNSYSYGTNSKRTISITGGIAYPVSGEDFEYWIKGFNFGANYHNFVSKQLLLGLEIDFSRFGFNPKSYLDNWNDWWNTHLTEDHVDGKERWLISISGILSVNLLEINKLKLFILGGIGLNLLSSSIITVNGEGKSFYSTYINPGTVIGLGISYKILPNTSFVLETKHHKNIPLNPELIESAGAVLLKTGFIFDL